MSITNLVSIRELTKEDLNFIIGSSVQSLSKYTESIVKGQDKDTAYTSLEKQVLFALCCMKYSTFIACDRVDSNLIMGYIVADTKNNHILLQYTKFNYRGLGIQQNLLLPLVIDPTLPITVNWPTKEMLKLTRLGKLKIQNKFTEQLMDMAVMNED